MRLHNNTYKGNIRLMFMDEAGFGRISEPSVCWCQKGVRPIVPCHRVREYIYTFGAICPRDGENFFLVLPRCNTITTNIFLSELSKAYPEDYILLCADNASWHKSQALIIPENIVMFYIPPCTPEMNPIEQIWKEIRKSGFKNTAFKSLDKVIEKLCEVIGKLSKDTVMSITGREWITSIS